MDKYNLQRFLDAQDAVIDGVLDELRRGEKYGHWMWYIFPQLQGLGSSTMAERYAIGCRNEAEAYLHHPILGQRLAECTRAVTTHVTRPIERIFGYPDHLKFHSCMTLFNCVAGAGSVFESALVFRATPWRGNGHVLVP